MKKQFLGDGILNICIYSIIILFSLICIAPFWLVAASSISDEISLVQNGYNFIPEKVSFAAYKLIFSTGWVSNAYKVTIFITVVGTALNLLFTSAMAYALSVKTVKYRNYVNFFVYFTMLFNGGLAPSYILISKYLNMKNSIWVMIIPVLVSAWNLFLLRNFYATIPESLSESAKIDGANDVFILFKIILPLSLPSMATIGLFYALGHWNEWFRALLYISDEEIYPLQYIIIRIIRSTSDISEQAREAGMVGSETIPAYSTQMATAIVTIGPIILAYPFVQKYFVKGLTVGGIKG